MGVGIKSPGSRLSMGLGNKRIIQYKTNLLEIHLNTSISAYLVLCFCYSFNPLSVQFYSPKAYWRLKFV